jgi:hypothetical protein
MKGKLVVVVTYGTLRNIQLTTNPFYSGKPTEMADGRPTFLPGNRVYHLRSELNLIKTDEAVMEIRKFISEYQIGIDLSGERSLPITVVILGIGEVENDDLGDDAMEAVMTTLTNIVDELDVSVLFAGVGEIPTRTTLRGRWFHELLEYLVSKAPVLEGNQVVYADIWTPDLITDLTVNKNGDVMEVMETPQVLGRLKMLSHLVAKFIANEVTLTWLGRPVIPPDYEAQQMEEVTQEAINEPIAEDEAAGSG